MRQTITMLPEPMIYWTRRQSLCMPTFRPRHWQAEPRGEDDDEYEHCGTSNVFCAVEAPKQHHFTFPTRIDRVRIHSPLHFALRYFREADDPFS